MLLLAQMVGHTPIVSMYDLVMGVLCSGLLLEFTKEAKRVVPETLAFLAGVIRLYSPDASKTAEGCTLPSLGVAADQETFTSLRASVSRFQSSSCPQLSLEKDKMNLDEMKTAVLASVLDLVRIVARSDHLKDSVEQECFAALAESLLALQPQAKPFPLNSTLQNKVRTTIKALSQVCRTENRLRLPLQRRAELSVRDKAIKSLAPRMEDPTKYSMSKDKGKNATQTALDRTRREYKREHKAVARELRTDAVFFEAERRADQDKRDSAAKAKRQKAFSWMEGEQATMNQQVRQGGGLLSGGGIGAARAKAKTAKVGMKKGGKLR
jgi:nucleolar protein 14